MGIKVNGHFFTVVREQNMLMCGSLLLFFEKMYKIYLYFLIYNSMDKKIRTNR